MLRKKQTPFSLNENTENLEQTIDKNISVLQEEYLKYKNILKYLGLYLEKVNEHLKKVTEAIELKKQKIHSQIIKILLF